MTVPARSDPEQSPRPSRGILRLQARSNHSHSLWRTVRVFGGGINQCGIFAQSITLVSYHPLVPSTHNREQFGEQGAFTLFTNANLRPVQRWMDPTSRYSLWLLERPPFTFPLHKSPDAVSASTPLSIPSPAEWETIWSAWDTITMGMISPQLLYEKPIDLRHICLFYLGHIPTFLDIHLSRLLGEPHTEPDNFKVNPDLS